MNKQSQIGIRWENGERIVAFPLSPGPGEADSTTELCDSDDSHNDFWPDAAMQFGLTEYEEYFNVSRGRVLWSQAKLTSIIYYGNATTKDRLTEIASAFQLARWESRTDMHYMMGSSVDDLFLKCFINQNAGVQR